MNHRDNRRHHCRRACALLAILCWTATPVRAADATIVLELTIANPTEEAQDIPIDAPLPGELTRDDILSTDGLDLRYDTSRRQYVVSGSVPLDANQTAVYQIRVKDVWTVGPERLAEYRRAAERLPEEEGERFLRLLGRIEREQERTRSDPSAHIAQYRERSKELERLDPYLPSEARGGVDRWGWPAAALLTALAAGWALTRRKTAAAGPGEVQAPADRRRAPRLLSPSNVVCRLLLSPDGAPPAETLSLVPKDLSEGGVCLELPEPFRAQSVLEIRIQLPSVEKQLVFRGTVAWQKRVVGSGPRPAYLTGVQLGEASYEDYRLLREYMEAHFS